MAEENIVIKIKADIGVTKDVIDAVTKAMENLGKTATIVTGNVKVTNKNLEDTNKVLGQVAQTATKTTNAIESNASALKKTNQQWTNLALVVQDLPFGFRAIQNNLPALFGSLAAGTGAAYFAFSALVAILTKYGDKIAETFITVSEAEKTQVAYNDIIKESSSTYAQAFTDVIQLKQAVQDAKDGFITKESVVKQYNETMGKTLGTQKNFKDVVDSIINQGDAYVDYIGKLTAANIAANKLGEAIVNMLETSQKKATEFVDGWDVFWSTKFNMNGIVASFTASGLELAKAGEKNKQIAIKQEGEKAVRLQEIWKNYTKWVNDARIKLNFTQDQGKFKQDTSLLDKLKSEEKLYSDDMFMKRAIGLEIVNEEERLAIQKATNEKASEETLKNIRAKYALDRQVIEQNTLNAIQEVRNNAENERAKKEEEASKRSEKTAKEINDRNLQNSLDALKIQSDTETKILLKSGKSTSSERIKILENYKSSLYDLASTGGYTADQLDKIDDAIVRVDAAIEGSKDVLKDFKMSLTDLSNQANEIITNLGRDLVSQLAENIGKALAGEKTDLFAGFIDMISDAAIGIGKAMIAYGIAIQAFDFAFSNPLAAIAAGAALVIAGNFLKTKFGEKANAKNQPTNAKPFASGGIVSGPTMGLIGEYPGAKANPEVVAPLDKLKDMLGGQGGGQFVLKGNDLVLALNRSETSLNLRRG